MASNITFPAATSPRDIPAHAVYTRQRWAGDWTLRPYLYCDWATWSAAPSVSQAGLSYRYGRGRRPGEHEFRDVEPLQGLNHHFVKIAINDADGVNQAVQGDDGTLRWYGTLDIALDRVDGSLYEEGGITPRGRQQFVCYGLERLLELTRITESVVKQGNKEFIIERPLIFNRGGAPNRSQKKGQKSYVFSGEVDPADAEYWSTRQIVDYLIAYQAPRDGQGQAKLPFDSRAAAPLPDWDRPEVDPRNLSLRELLNTLISRQRLYGWKLKVPASEATINLTAFTFLENQLALDQQQTAVIPQNLIQVNIAFDRDAAARATGGQYSVDRYDQILVRGARRRSVFSIHYEVGGIKSHTLAAGWNPFAQTFYNDAAINEPNYPAATWPALRQRANAEYRSRPELQEVYARFQLPDNWDGKVPGITGLGFKFPVFPDDRNSGQSAPINQRELKLLATVPFLSGKDYSQAHNGTITTSGSAPHEELPLTVWLRRPDLASLNLGVAMFASERWSRIEEGAAFAEHEMLHEGDLEHRWSASVRVVPQSRALRIRVHGQPQHILASADWSPADSSDTLQGPFNWRTDLIATVACEDDRYCESSWPKTVAGLDAVRRLVIDAGDGFRLDWAVRGTVWGLKSDQSLATILGNGAMLRDDRPALERIARLAYAWYGQDRNTLEFATSLVTRRLDVGDMVLEVGDQSIEGAHQIPIKSVITEMSVMLPAVGEAGPAPPPKIEYRTGFAELDPLAFVES